MPGSDAGLRTLSSTQETPALGRVNGQCTTTGLVFFIDSARTSPRGSVTRQGLQSVDLAMKQLSLPPSLQHTRNAGSLVNPKAGVEKGCRVTAGKKMIAIAHAMAMAVPKPPADPLAARGCPA